jgi:hypothetical protein
MVTKSFIASICNASLLLWSFCYCMASFVASEKCCTYALFFILLFLCPTLLFILLFKGASLKVSNVLTRPFRYQTEQTTSKTPQT